MTDGTWLEECDSMLNDEQKVERSVATEADSSYAVDKIKNFEIKDVQIHNCYSWWRRNYFESTHDTRAGSSLYRRPGRGCGSWFWSIGTRRSGGKCSESSYCCAGR